MKPGIVIVDPNLDSIHKLSQMLITNGKNILATASEYDESESLIHLHNPTIAFVGLEENPYAGMRTIQKIRDISPKTNVIVTSYTELTPQIIRQCKELNIVGITRYPFHKINKLKTVYPDAIKTDMLVSKLPKPVLSAKGILVSIGFVPGEREWAMISHAGLEYLGFRNNFIALNYFKQKKTNVAALIQNQSLEIMSYTSQNFMIMEDLVEKDHHTINEKKVIFHPWQEVIRYAQIQYQDYWNTAIKEGILPQFIPCLITTPGMNSLHLLSQTIMDSLEITPVEGKKAFHNFALSDIHSDLAFEQIMENIGHSLVKLESRFPAVSTAAASSKTVM